MGDHLIYKPSQAMQSLSAMERDNINKISNYFLHTCFPVMHLLFVIKMEFLGKLWEIFGRILAKKGMLSFGEIWILILYLNVITKKSICAWSLNFYIIV